MSARKILTDLGACSEAVEWAGDRDIVAAWEECPRGEWLLWVAERAGVDRRRLTLAGCACARTALRYVTPGDDRPRVAIEAAEAWARGEASAAAKDPAWAYAWAAIWAAASDSALDAASAAANAEHARLVREMITLDDVLRALDARHVLAE